jgi:hypothetical protein
MLDSLMSGGKYMASDVTAADRRAGGDIATNRTRAG